MIARALHGTLGQTVANHAKTPGPTAIDTSPTGSQYTQGLVYQGYGTTYLDILRNQIAAAKQ